MGSSGWRGSIRLAEAVWYALVDKIRTSGKNQIFKNSAKNLITPHSYPQMRGITYYEKEKMGNTTKE